MNYRIVTDSAANILEIEGMELGTVPLHVIVGDKDFIDDKSFVLEDMQSALKAYKGKTSTSCPSPKEWQDAFGDAEAVFCVTITSGLSGSNASAVIAKDMYESEHEGRKVYIFDSLSTGPEMVLIIEKIKQLILEGKHHEEINKAVCEYQKSTHLYFSLGSLYNLARNGRVNPLLATGVGLLGIRIVGKASDEGTLQPMDKCRGDKKAFKCLIEHMKKCGYKDGKIILAHNNNLSGVEELKKMIAEAFGKTDILCHQTTALCSYYAEPQSVLVGFEA